MYGRINVVVVDDDAADVAGFVVVAVVVHFV